MEKIETTEENWHNECNTMIEQNYILIVEDGKIFWVKYDAN